MRNFLSRSNAFGRSKTIFSPCGKCLILPCLIFTHENNIDIYQWLNPVHAALLTLLSTEAVQNCRCLHSYCSKSLLIIRRCANVTASMPAWRCLAANCLACHFFTQDKKSLMNQWLWHCPWRLRTILSTECVQNCAKVRCPATDRDHHGRSGRLSKMAVFFCLFFMQGKNILLNQCTGTKWAALLTILSTEYVRNQLERWKSYPARSRSCF